MTVEIKELIIRATLASEAPTENTCVPAQEVDVNHIVATCVKQVLTFLERAKER